MEIVLDRLSDQGPGMIAQSETIGYKWKGCISKGWIALFRLGKTNSYQTENGFIPTRLLR